MDLNGANIVITGASSGIGKELLKQLRAFDCNIVATARSMESLKDSGHPNVYYKNFDLKEKENIDALFDYALEKMGRIDLFIANAGFMYYEKIYPPDLRHIEEIFRLNVTGVIYSAVKMKEISGNQPYNFVALSSAFGFFTAPGYALYCSTKAALRGFGQGYKYELQENQHYQSVYPIAVKTDFFIKADLDSPPKPQQSKTHVAKTIIRGIQKNQGEIHPSKSFWFIKTFMPYLLNIAVLIEKRKFRKKLK
jgi:uncharacterized protein